MNATVLYDVICQIVNHMSLELRLRRVLRDFAQGMLASGSCLLGDVAKALIPLGQEESQYRRLQRFLANPRVDVAQLQQDWAQMVIQFMAPESLILLVDETALSKHLKIMVLGIWTPAACVPIAWRCYHPKQYPACGQVGVITDLLDRVRSVFPIPMPVTILADRGIGTSPNLIRQIDERGMDVLFRVQGTTRFCDDQGQEIPLRDIGIPGQVWQSVGDVFKKAEWLTLCATVAWGTDYKEPWCLVSSQPINPALYGVRFDQEGSFRDLKSDGFEWHRSHVWLPEHAERLLLVLAIVYWLIIVIGQAIPPAKSGRAARWSTFRRGWEAARACFRPTIAPMLPDLARPRPPPFISCVVQ